MQILIVTQKLDKDDENLGFFHRWVEEFAKHVGRVTVIASYTGPHAFPANVEVRSLGKEKGMSYLRRIWRYAIFFWRHSKAADAIFFHMIPEFVLAAAPTLFFRRRPTALWYVHKSVTWRLKFAEHLVDWIFTASPLSFRLPSKKVLYTGHAIDTETFQPTTYNLQPTALRLLTVGRISPVKDIETIIQACSFLKENWQRQWSLSIVGGPLMPRDGEYLLSLKKLVSEKSLAGYVSFYGARPWIEVPQIYNEHDVFISMSTTGSIDKSVLEAMSGGLTVITANEAFQSLLPARCFLEKRSPEFLAERIKMIADDARPSTALRNLVVERHSLEKTIKKIIDAYSRL